MTEPTITLRVAAGDGLLMRHGDVVLFIPRADDGVDDLLDAVRTHAGGVDASFDALAEIVVQLDFAVPEFVCVGLANRFKIRVFGGVEVVTDLASVPMLSGSGSTTWVEHSAALPTDLATTVTVSGDHEIVASELPRTDLVQGVVPAGGFRLIAAPACPDPSVDSDGSHGNSAASEEPADSAAGAEGRVAAAIDALGPAAATTPTDESTDPAADQPNEPSTNQEPEDEIEAALPSAMSIIDDAPASDVFDVDLADAVSVQETTAEEPIAEHVDDGQTLVPPPPPAPETPPPPSATPPSTPPAPATPAPPGTAGAMVMARPCPSGHANRPSRVTCSVCESFLASGQDVLEVMVRPPVGELVFTDGTRHILDKNLVVGRAPTPSEGVESDVKVVRSDQISRRHFEISIKDWDVFVEDCGSRNGTVLVPADGAAPVKVEAGMPQLIEPGAAIHFADQVITLVAVGDGPVAINGNEASV